MTSAPLEPARRRELFSSGYQLTLLLQAILKDKRATYDIGHLDQWSTRAHTDEVHDGESHLPSFLSFPQDAKTITDQIEDARGLPTVSRTCLMPPTGVGFSLAGLGAYFSMATGSLANGDPGGLAFCRSPSSSCAYVLTLMPSSRISFEEALYEGQDLDFVDGSWASHYMRPQLWRGVVVLREDDYLGCILSEHSSRTPDVSFDAATVPTLRGELFCLLALLLRQLRHRSLQHTDAYARPVVVSSVP